MARGHSVQLPDGLQHSDIENRLPYSFITTVCFFINEGKTFKKLLTNRAIYAIIFRHENIFAPVAQLVEHLTFNQGVRSSILRRSTITYLPIGRWVLSLIPGCSAVGSARALGARCRRFESCHSDQNCRFGCFCGQIGANLIRHRRLCTVVP